jgi:hypothetical protein
VIYLKRHLKFFPNSKKWLSHFDKKRENIPNAIQPPEVLKSLNIFYVQVCILPMKKEYSFQQNINCGNQTTPKFYEKIVII